MSQVREYIAQALRRAGKHYQFTVSIGCYRHTPPRDGIVSIQGEAELFLRNADEAMYQEKERAKARGE